MDQPQIQETTARSIAETTWVIRKRLGEPGILLPPHDRYWDRIGDDRIAVFEDNLKWLKTNQEIFQQIANYYREFRYPFIPHLDADASLYQIGFYSRDDEKLCRTFQGATLEKKANMIDQFSSPDARTLAWRVIARNYPEALPADYVNEHKKYMKRINPAREKDALVDYREAPRTTPKAALAEIDRLKYSGELEIAQIELLEDLEKYIKTQFKLNTDQDGQTLIDFGES